ncbi:DNA damage-binding protein CMR1 [Euphorbia peplus]|nr:DNA damage-binding protein CMR1 [Euphorbia peplus]
MAPSKITDYEKKRQENIRRNDEILAALKVSSKAFELSASSKRHRVESFKSFKVSPEKKKPKPDSPVVIRRSLRFRGLPPDSKGLDGDLVSTPVPSTVKEPLSPVMGPVSFTNAYSGSGSDRALIDTILSLRKKHEGECVVPVKEDIDRCESLKMEESHEALLECGIKIEKKETESSVDPWSMKLEPENIARVMPGRIMVVKFLPSNDVKMIAAGNKMGNVAFWKPDSPGEEDGDGIYLYHPHTAPVSGILFQKSCLCKIFTSCYDGFLRMMNAEKEVFDLIYSSDDAIFSLSQRPNDMNGLYFSEGRGGLSILDERTRKLSSQWMLHESRINTIDFNSQNPNMMATSSTDGTACLWDLRSVNADKPNCLQTVTHKRAVHSAYFSPSGSFLATTSLDDTVGILNCANFEDKSSISHYNHTGRWISSFRCIWGWDDTYLYMGNMKRGIDVISRLRRRTVLTLESPNMSAIPCRFDIHPHNVGMLAGGTGGGQVYMWTST